MKNLCKLIGVAALTTAMVFSMIACDNGSDPGTGHGTGSGPAPQSVTYNSGDSDGNFYTLVVTEKTSRSEQYTVKNGDSFTFTVELFKNGSYSVALTCSGTIESAEDDGTEIEIKITVNGKPLTITIKGTEMTVISGTIVLDNEEEITIIEPLTPANAPEDWPVAKRWYGWVDDFATVTLNYSIASDGVCTVTVGGTAQPNDDTDNWGKWKAEVSYSFTAETNKRYKHTFEAWTQSGTRTLSGNCYNDWAGDRTSIGYAEFAINAERQNYTVYGGKIPKGGVRALEFDCADQVGTFYVKMLKIEEYEIEELDDFPPEVKPQEARWSKWVENDCTATLDYSTAYTSNNGGLMCTITVGGSADPTEWKARAQYSYTAEANTSYIYGFNAWTQSGTRTLTIEYYNDWENNITLTHNITITTKKQWFSLEGVSIPKGRVCQMAFLCADKTGTFYVDGLWLGVKDY